MIKIIFMIIILGLTLGCCEKNQEVKTNIQPPPGYKILCNYNNTKFLVQSTYGMKIRNKDGEEFKSYNSAVEMAWSIWNGQLLKREVKDTTSWKECP